MHPESCNNVNFNLMLYSNWAINECNTFSDLQHMADSEIFLDRVNFVPSVFLVVAFSGPPCRKCVTQRHEVLQIAVKLTEQSFHPCVKYQFLEMYNVYLLFWHYDDRIEWNIQWASACPRRLHVKRTRRQSLKWTKYSVSWERTTNRNNHCMTWMNY
jgi:hypothetical protein